MYLYVFTGSWIVTCGTELGVVRFIEEAINAHVAMKKLHIPIVGILSKRVNTEMIKVSNYALTNKMSVLLICAELFSIVNARAFICTVALSSKVVI